LKTAIASPIYEQAVATTHAAAFSLLKDLPNLTAATPESLIKAAQQDAEFDEVLSVVRLFQWLLPGLAVNVAYLRAQLMQ